MKIMQIKNENEIGWMCTVGGRPQYTFEQLMFMNRSEINYQLREAAYHCQMYLLLNCIELYRQWQNYYHDVEKIWRCMNEV